MKVIVGTASRHHQRRGTDTSTLLVLKATVAPPEGAPAVRVTRVPVTVASG